MRDPSESRTLTLLGDDGRHRYRIGRRGTLRLLTSILLEDAQTRTQQLIELAFNEVGWAAWLVDQVSQGLRGRVLTETFDGSSGMGAFPVEPPFWTLVEKQVREFLDSKSFYRRLLAAFGELAVSEQLLTRWTRNDTHVWNRCHGRLIEGDTDQKSSPSFAGVRRSTAFYWWACYFGVGLWDEDHQSLEPGLWQVESDVGTRTRDVATAEQGSAEEESDLLELARLLLTRCSRLFELESNFDKQLEHEKLLAMKELAYGASHEINNPLANISSRAQMLLRDEDNEKRRKALAAINRQAFRAHEMIADMMLFAKPPAMERVCVAWDEWVDQVTCGLAEECGDSADLRFEHDEGDEASVWIDPVQLEVAVRAVFKNAVEACGQTGLITVRTNLKRSLRGTVERLTIEVADNGPGIRDEVRRHLFDPFYSGREAGRGLGFGLSKAWRIAECHGGEVVVDSRPGSTSIALSIPAAELHSTIGLS